MSQSPTQREAIAALRRATQGKPDNAYIIISDRRQRWLWEAAEICVGLGFLEPGRLHEFDEQSSELRYVVTAKWRAVTP